MYILLLINIIYKKVLCILFNNKLISQFRIVTQPFQIGIFSQIFYIYVFLQKK